MCPVAIPAGVTATLHCDNVPCPERMVRRKPLPTLEPDPREHAPLNDDKVLMRDTWPLLERIPFPKIARGRLDTLQVNVGYRCNQSCVHCHVNAGPNRTEEMDGATVDVALAFLERRRIGTLDITGGAPELNPHFRRLVKKARDMGVRVMDRCNLTILEVPGQEDLAEFLAAQQVEIVASMPCYLLDNVDRQRGRGVFDGSIRGLRRLNALGYGRDETGLVLNLVYNPQGPSLPPAQGALEADYRRVLGETYGIVFNALYTLANMPIQRFGAILISKGQFDEYLALLRRAHLDANLDGVMCRSLISIDYRGYVYDCDFNQMLDLPLWRGARERVHLSEIMDEDLAGNPIRVAGHCFGCTAGQGSSCGGALKQAAE
jgi:radical SAM/Cys-rich protein